MIKEVIIFGTGVAVGAASVYFCLKNKFEEKAHAEIEAIREYYSGTVNVVNRKTENKVEAQSNTSAATNNSLPPLSTYRTALEIAKKNDYISYDKVSTQSDDVEDSPEDDDPGDVYVIPFEKYQSDENYGGETLTWYEGDNALTRPDDSLVDIHECIGDNLSAFNNSPNKEVIYVRNEHHMVDYEVIRDPRSFKVDILGEDDD